MSQMHFDGPVDVGPELAMALFNAMPAIGQAGVAQMFAARLMSGPLSDKAIEAAARVYAERIKIGAAGAKALREGVAEKCRALGDKSVNEAAVRAIVDDEIRKATAEFAKAKVETLISALPLGALVAAATPAVESVVKALAQQYFSRTQEGQNWILGLIAKVKEEQENGLAELVRDRMFRATEPRVGDNGPLTLGESVP